MAGGAGKSLMLLPLPATAASAIITRDARTRVTAYCCFMLKNSFQKWSVLTAKISSVMLEVASLRGVDEIVVRVVRVTTEKIVAVQLNKRTARDRSDSSFQGTCRCQ